jgi:hypothetical protein
MTLNWGHKLIGVFLVFAGMMSWLVYQSVTTRFDLVSKEYYKDELQYQQVIDGTKRANQLSNKVTIEQNGHHILLRLPNEMKQTAVTGSILFYCADDARKDKKMPLQVNTDAVQQIDARQFLFGNYTAKISWESHQQLYYAETRITIVP